MIEQSVKNYNVNWLNTEPFPESKLLFQKASQINDLLKRQVTRGTGKKKQLEGGDPAEKQLKKRKQAGMKTIQEPAEKRSRQADSIKGQKATQKRKQVAASSTSESSSEATPEASPKKIGAQISCAKATTPQPLRLTPPGATYQAEFGLESDSSSSTENEPRVTQQKVTLPTLSLSPTQIITKVVGDTQPQSSPQSAPTSDSQIKHTSPQHSSSSREVIIPKEQAQLTEAPLQSTNDQAEPTSSPHSSLSPKTQTSQQPADAPSQLAANQSDPIHQNPSTPEENTSYDHFSFSSTDSDYIATMFEELRVQGAKEALARYPILAHLPVALERVVELKFYLATKMNTWYQVEQLLETFSLDNLKTREAIIQNAFNFGTLEDAYLNQDELINRMIEESQGNRCTHTAKVWKSAQQILSAADWKISESRVEEEESAKETVPTKTVEEMVICLVPTGEPVEL